MKLDELARAAGLQPLSVRPIRKRYKLSGRSARERHAARMRAGWANAKGSPYYSVEAKIGILKGLLAMARDGDIGPIYCEDDMRKLSIGEWIGPTKKLPPLLKRLSWPEAARMVRQKNA